MKFRNTLFVRLAFLLIIVFSSKTVLSQVNPASFNLSTGNFTFGAWPGASAGGTFFPSSRWHRCAISQAPLAQPTSTDYTGLYAPANPAAIVEGLDGSGFAFTTKPSVNNLGAFVVGLNSTGRSNITASFVAQETSVGSVFRVRLQYRLSRSSNWIDFPGPIEFIGDGVVDGAQTAFGPINLSALVGNAIDNRANMQIRWKYYWVSGIAGPTKIRIDDITISSSAMAGNSVAVDSLNIPAAGVCVTPTLGSTFTFQFRYAPTANFTSGTCVFTAQLSNAFGSFVAPTNIGTVTSTANVNGQLMSVTIPPGTPSGTGYRIRVVSASPAATSASDNGYDLTIKLSPTEITGLIANCDTTTSMLNWTLPTTSCYDELMVSASLVPTTTSPSGNGSVYTANSMYGSGTAYDNGFVVYKGSGTSIVITNLMDGFTYYFKVWVRYGSVWSAGAETSCTLYQICGPSISTTVVPPSCAGGSTGAIQLNVSGDTANVSNPGLLISEIQTDPALADSPKEWVELIATRSINFAQTPYTIIFSNNGTATSKGWVEGSTPSPPPRNATYAFQINTGSVQPGDVVYVGGTSMAPSGVRLRQKNTATEAGDGNIGGAFTGATGVLGNGGGIADGVAVFNLPVALIDSNTVPVDAIFFGSGIGDAAMADTSLGFRLPVNDRYMGGRLKSSSFLAPELLGFYSLQANGAYDRSSGVYSTPRTWTTNTTAWASSVSGITVSSYTYLWSNGATTKDISGLTVGTYTVTVTSGSCTVNGSYTVTQNSQLNVSLTPTSTSCAAAANGAANATVSGGVAPYTYLWSNGSTTSDINQLTVGAYTVTVTDAAGCTVSATTTVSMGNNFPSVTLTSGSVICNGATNGSMSSSVSGSVAPYMYLWSNGSTASGISNLAAGTYTLTVTDANGCASTQSADVQQTAAVSVTSISPAQNSAGYPVALRGSGLAGITQVKFNGVNAAGFSISGDTLIAATVPVNAGSGSVQLFSGNGCGYQSTATFTYIFSSPDLTVKLYIEGLYVGGGYMELPLVNSGLSGNAQHSDSITLQLAQPTAPYAIVWTGSTILRSNGIALTNLPGMVIGQSYYIVVKHRSSLETWSKHPVLFGPNTYWNFSGIPQFPTLTTTVVSGVQNTTSISGGTISSDGGSAVNARGVCWSTAPGPTVALATKTSNGSGTGSFTSNLSGLSKNTMYYVRAYATNGVGTAYGNEISFTTLNLPVDINGNAYDTVVIGTQVWMSKNLRVSKYRNGDPIPTNISNNSWSFTTSGAYAIHNNTAANDSIYGKLYNWYAVADPRGLCPVGWHVPSDAEWQTLETALGMPVADLNIVGSRGSVQNVGGKMKAISPLWNSPNTGADDSSGFSGLPGGARNFSSGTYDDIGLFGGWWSSTQHSTTHAWSRTLNSLFGDVYRNSNHQTYGLSVRCVRD